MDKWENNVQALIDKLTQLTVSEIRDFFQEEGIKGKVGSFSECPVAVWIKKNVNYENLNIEVGQGSLRVGSAKSGRYYFLSRNISWFIEDFDGLRYPELIR